MGLLEALSNQSTLAFWLFPSTQGYETLGGKTKYAMPTAHQHQPQLVILDDTLTCSSCGIRHGHAPARLVLPMAAGTVLRLTVHLLCPDLDLEGLPLTFRDEVQRAISVGFGMVDGVLLLGGAQGP